MIHEGAYQAYAEECSAVEPLRCSPCACEIPYGLLMCAEIVLLYSPNPSPPTHPAQVAPIVDVAARDSVRKKAPR
jgi:hypothetical protein